MGATKDATSTPTKVVVRLLPPLITEDELLSTIAEEHVTNATHRTFIVGRRVKGDKPSLNALCYLYYKTAEHADAFIRDYHGHQFVDDQGEQFRAVACYAPYQKVPKTRGKDPREGTIEDDEAYQLFVENLSKPKEAFVAPDDPKFSLKPAVPGETPLLLFIKKKAEERKSRKESRYLKEKAKWWPEGDSIPEEDYYASGKKGKGKWRCSECKTSKGLEEDPDNRGTFYCTQCWESWETSATSKKSKKKKKKHSMYEDEEWKEDEWKEDEGPSSRRSRKKKEKEAAAEDWYGTGEEEGESRSKRKKKKDKEAQSWAEEDWSSGWKAKDSWEEAPSKKEKKGRKKDRGDDSKWVEKGTERADDGQGAGSKWKKKGEDEGDKEEKPRRSRKEKRDDSWWS